MIMEELEVAARQYALKALGVTENQLVGVEIERKVKQIAQNFVAGAKWNEEVSRKKV